MWEEQMTMARHIGVQGSSEINGHSARCYNNLVHMFTLLPSHRYRWRSALREQIPRA